jgi:putative tricarboxylic transport membrane protein
MGTVAAKPSVVELGMLFTFGFLGLLMRRWDYPVAPMVVGLILGPMAEAQLRRSLQMTLGDPMVFLENPGSATLLAIAAIALVAPLAIKGLDRLRVRED